MKNKKPFLFLFLSGISLYALNTGLSVPVSNFHQDINPEVLRKQIVIKNIRTLEQLNEELSRIQQMLLQKKLLEQKRKMTERQKEELERKKRQEKIQEEQDKIAYKQRMLNIQKQKMQLQEKNFLYSDEYKKELIANIEDRLKFILSLLEEKLKKIRGQDDTLVKVYDVYSVGHSYAGHVTLDMLSKAVAYLKQQKQNETTVKLEIKRIKHDLNLLEKNKNLVERTFLKEKPILENTVNIISNIVQDIDNINVSFSKEASLAPESVNLFVYPRTTNPDNYILIKEGDMIAPNVQVKKIRKSYAIIGFVTKDGE